MTTVPSLVLFGVTSPIVVEFEETLRRCGTELAAGILVEGKPRLLARQKIVSLEDSARFAQIAFLPCAFATQNRRQLTTQAQALGFRLAACLADPHAVIAGSTRIGAGSYVNAGVVIGAASMLGDCVLVNRSVSIGHHCLLGDYVSVGPGATIASNVRIDESATIGAGAVILPDIRIGAGAVVAAGAVVRRAVEPGTVVAGNPAQVSRRRSEQTRVWRNSQE